MVYFGHGVSNVRKGQLIKSLDDYYFIYSHQNINFFPLPPPINCCPDFLKFSDKTNVNLLSLISYCIIVI